MYYYTCWPRSLLENTLCEMLSYVDATIIFVVVVILIVFLLWGNIYINREALPSANKNKFQNLNSSRTYDGVRDSKNSCEFKTSGGAYGRGNAYGCGGAYDSGGAYDCGDAYGCNKYSPQCDRPWTATTSNCGDVNSDQARMASTASASLHWTELSA